MAALVAIGGHGDTEDVRSSGYEDVEGVRSCGETPSISCDTKAEALAESQTPISVIGTVMSSLKEAGAQASAAHLQNAIRTEKRRARASSREDQDVIIARVGTAKGIKKWPRSESGDSCCKMKRRGRWQQQ